jgi:hypothetical protein
MVGLSLRMAPHTTGYLHVQTNPKLAYSAQKTIKNAESKPEKGDHPVLRAG